MQYEFWWKHKDAVNWVIDGLTPEEIEEVRRDPQFEWGMMVAGVWYKASWLRPWSNHG